jgi:GDP-4-dehydro-6-deoxy-D-mannose reductase
MPRALITGAAGFAGRHLRAWLNRRGWEVIGSDYRPDAGDLHADMRDAQEVEQMVAQAADITHVFHLAAKTFVPDAHKDPADTYQANVLGTVYLAQALRRHAPEARMIYVSSGDAYGPPLHTPVSEDHPLRPTHPYAISKATADHHCAWLGAHGMDVVRVRPFNHSGPGQPDVFVLSSFARQCAAIALGLHEPVIRVGNLDSLRDFSHVDDVVEAYELVALRGKTGDVYNICSGRAVRIREALDLLVTMTGVSVEIRPDPERQRPGEASPVPASNARLCEATGWTPRHSLEALLRDLFEHWRKTLAAEQHRNAGT